MYDLKKKILRKRHDQVEDVITHYYLMERMFSTEFTVEKHPNKDKLIERAKLHNKMGEGLKQHSTYRVIDNLEYNQIQRERMDEFLKQKK